MQSSVRDFKRSHLEVNAHVRPVSAMCLMHLPSYNADGETYLVTVCRAGTLKLWDINSSSRMHLADSVYYYFKIVD